MRKVTIILNDGPASHRTMSGLRIADGLLDANMEVKIVLSEDAVFCAKRGQKPPAGLEGLNTSEKLRKLIGLGVEVFAWSICMQSRGLTVGELVGDVIEGCLMDAVNAIKDGDKVLVF